jgi:inhibitor of the pro-sigma K processing machinery
MAVGIDKAQIIKYALIIFAIYGIGYTLYRFFRLPIKLLVFFIINSAIGCGIMFLINLFFKNAGFIIPLNIYTVCTAGVLGIPGIILLILLKLLL